MAPAPTLSGLLAGLLVAISLGSPAEARSSERSMGRAGYDGNWSVLILTNSGPCDRGYRYGLSIRGLHPKDGSRRIFQRSTERRRRWCAHCGKSLHPASASPPQRVPEHASPTQDKDA